MSVLSARCSQTADILVKLKIDALKSSFQSCEQLAAFFTLNTPMIEEQTEK